MMKEGGEQSSWLLMSPYVLVLVSYAVFLLALVFPPDVYFLLVNEPSIIFRDFSSLVFFSVCAFAFIAGFFLVDGLVVFPASRTLAPDARHYRVFLAAPLVLGICLNTLSSCLLLQENPGMLDMLLAGKGFMIKETLREDGTLAQASILLMGLVWWALWRRADMVRTGRKDWLVLVLTGVAIASLFVSATLKLARGELIPLVFGVAVIYLLDRLRTGHLDVAFVLRFSAFFLIAVVLIFFAFSALRGAQSLDYFLADILGYTLSSYNRMAAMLHGDLHYPFAGDGLYLSSFISFNGSFNKLLPVSSWMAWPEYQLAWRSEFEAVWEAGLYGDLIWSGAFGYLFADFGWFAAGIVFFYGLACAVFWQLLRSGSPFGIILYPWFAFSIAFWFGSNVLLDTKLVVLCAAAFLMAVYEAAFSGRIPVRKMILSLGLLRK